VFINQITLVGTTFVAANSKKIVQNTNTILYYSKGEPTYKNWTYITEMIYDKEDEYGEYRTQQGGRQNERGKKGIIDNPHLWIATCKGYIKKAYKGTEDLQRPYTSDWMFNGINQKYPTQKPYKLLERIICSSTL
jgi:DNA modification methylase